ncbi:MAG: hypothetical protein GX675_05295 [Erysipelotrichaceae bacterium]|nr:hypothetical protein [Erysipelotrichaceae bacterium]
MSENKDLLKVIDEMLEKLDNDDSEIINQTNTEFNSQLKSKLNEVATKKGYSDYTSMLIKKVNKEEQDNIYEETENEFISNYVKNSILNIEYEARQMGLYKDGHQEALNKYYDKLKSNEEIDLILKECYLEEAKISIVDILLDMKLKGYKDGLYLFKIIVEDAIQEFYESKDLR